MRPSRVLLQLAPASLAAQEPSLAPARAFSSKLSVDADVSDRYRTTAGQYDSDVDLAERTMRMGKKRRDLIQRARGHVLEVSVGTGRNLPYYLLGERRGVDKDGKAAVLGCRSVTFIDLWPEMVDIARWKYETMGSNKEKGNNSNNKAEVVFLAQDAMGEVRSPAGTKFDTVVQTMGLCSHPEPVNLLKHLGELLSDEDEDHDDGRILLLEHGRGHYGWLNGLLDGLAAAHADRHGCWWNRDIGEIVRQSGLEVVEARRYHLGTTWDDQDQASSSPSLQSAVPVASLRPFLLTLTLSDYQPASDWAIVIHAKAGSAAGIDSTAPLVYLQDEEET
ncbi:oxa1 multicopy suppressor [Trichophyton equinum CBS 127.97]|uniref:Oxa1 multicopy suppressor n=1 Tax=Trichophyton equinum (strain ATCC MYA-4606 / CBS 127.97) TaxID=559882 RepID=F2PW83_TRIEC|nr:oxa1 multicopy suppressor [Trichophyton equinum CBS 127.97]